MSLNYDLTNIKDWSNRCFLESPDEKGDDGKPARKMRGDLQTIIWNTIAVDIGTIEAENIDEWLWRIEFLKRVGKGVCGNFPDGTVWWPDRETLTKYIGLRVNVPFVKRKSWTHIIANSIAMDVTRKMMDDALKKAAA